MECAVREPDGELSGARVELQSPSPLVGLVMVEAAQREQVVEIGEPVRVPFEEVMNVAPIEMTITSVDGTGAIHRVKRGPL